MNPKRIAKVCHEAVSAYRQSVNKGSNAAWDNLHATEQDSVIGRVELAFEHLSKRQMLLEGDMSDRIFNGIVLAFWHSEHAEVAQAAEKPKPPTPPVKLAEKPKPVVAPVKPAGTTKPPAKPAAKPKRSAPLAKPRGRKK